jgi:hypothetical protein
MAKQIIKPQKPTQPFGYTAFSKTGKVSRVDYRLSSEKELQEKQAIDRFIEVYNICFPDLIITDVQQLPENDHDFNVKIGNKSTIIQLTELVDRTFTFPLTEDEYKHKIWDAYIQKGFGEILWGIDIRKQNDALTDLIKLKLSKNYGANSDEDIWLVIFSTFIYEAESSQNGKKIVSEGLKKARQFLEQTDSVVFSKIWYSNLITIPVLIWPTNNGK